MLHKGMKMELFWEDRADLSPRWRRAARGISTLLHPFWVPIWIILTLLFSDTLFAHSSLMMRLYLLGVVALYGLLLPLLGLFLMRSVGWLKDLRLAEPRQRRLPLLMGVIFYLLCALTLSRIPSAYLLQKAILGAAGCELLCLLVTLRWKISLHLTGMGAATALLAILTFAGVGNLLTQLIAAILLSGMLASARLYLGSHNGWQVLAGYVGGAVVMWIAILM